MDKALPPIPAKRYFTIGEVSELCGVKPYVLRYWEQEFTQLKPMKRRGNRRYYQHHEVLLIRRIRELLYDQGFTISGARNQLGEAHVGAARTASRGLDGLDSADSAAAQNGSPPGDGAVAAAGSPADGASASTAKAPPLTDLLPIAEVFELPLGLREELLSIRGLLTV